MLTDILVNPTPFDVELQYTAGISINISSDGKTKLTMQQLNDYREGNPGSEETRKELEYHGLFILDGDRSYDAQAFTAIRASRVAKKRQFDDFVQRLRDRRSSIGSPVDPEAMEEAINMAGHGKIRDEIGKLDARLKHLQREVGEDVTGGLIAKQLDPRRTCFILEPPKEFASETALKMFLDENPEVAIKHKEYIKTVGKSA